MLNTTHARVFPCNTVTLRNRRLSTALAVNNLGHSCWVISSSTGYTPGTPVHRLQSKLLKRDLQLLYKSRSRGKKCDSKGTLHEKVSVKTDSFPAQEAEEGARPCLYMCTQ